MLFWPDESGRIRSEMGWEGGSSAKWVVMGGSSANWVVMGGSSAKWVVMGTSVSGGQVNVDTHFLNCTAQNQ